MSFEVDTAEVKRVAEEIKAIAGEVRQLSRSNVSRMQSNVEENLKGDTANAIMEVLQDLSNDITKIGSGLDTIQRELMEYVKRLEAADRAASELIEG